MTIWFFGDSWPAGAELIQFKNFFSYKSGAAPELAYPSIVGNLLSIEICNRAIPASSQERMIEQFLISDIKKK